MKSKEFNQLHIAEHYIKMLNNYDVVIGPIADDRMNEVINAFTRGMLTDEGLMYCLQAVDYGEQVVLKTPFACSKAEIIQERSIYGKEADDVRKYAHDKQKSSRDVVDYAVNNYQRKGLYLREIIAKERKDTEERPGMKQLQQISKF